MIKMLTILFPELAQASPSSFAGEHRPGPFSPMIAVYAVYKNIRPGISLQVTFSPPCAGEVRVKGYSVYETGSE